MKLITTIAATTIALSAAASAAIYIPSNVVSGDGSADGIIQNSDNTLNVGGIFAMGYFTNGYVISTTDMVSNIAAFTITASGIVGGNSDTLSGSFAGYVEGATVNGTDIVAPNSLIGRPLYVFVGNSGTLAGSTEWAIKQIATLTEDLPNENEYLGNPFGGAAPVFGSFGTFTGNASGFGSSTYTTLQLAAIPEPSAALLGAIGMLGLLRRRRA